MLLLSVHSDVPDRFSGSAGLAVALVATALALMYRNPWDAGCHSVALYLLGCGVLLISIAPAAVAFPRPVMFVVIACILIEVAGGFWLMRFFNTEIIAPRLLVLDLPNPEQSVADARQLMVDVKERDEKRADDLPESLRIPHLRYATIYPDHVDLVIRRDPDEQEGFRIWSATSHRAHHDRPTRYRDIFSYLYNNDETESPDNIP